VVYSPLLAIGTYFALGALVLASRMLFPRATVTETVVERPRAENEQTEYAKAA
jgi:hypothetical protein